MPTSNFNRHFPGYDILGELGRGNARVLKAKNQITGELVAIKHFALHTDAATLQRFQRESEIMTSIQHPNIVRIRDVQLDAELPYIVMELIEGGDLRSLLTREHRLDLSSVIRLGLQMAEAFRAIHDTNIVHRDIKPENIMYRMLPSGEYHFLLTDFGIARLRERSGTVTGTAMMTYEYASPEQFDNPAAVAAATDYYSLGAVLYECLTGKPPFAIVDGKVHTLMSQVVNDPPPDLQQAASEALPPALCELVARLLEKDPGQRLSDSVQLKKLLKQAEYQELDAAAGAGEYPQTDSAAPDPAPPPAPANFGETSAGPSLPPAPPQPRKSRRGAAIGWFMLLLLLAGGAIWYGLRREHSYPQTAAPERGAVRRSTAQRAPETSPAAEAGQPVSPRLARRIGQLLDRYYALSSGSNCPELSSWFAEVVDNYYNRRGLSRDEIIADCEAYAAKWQFREGTMVPGSLDVTERSDGSYNVRYRLKYRFRKTADDPWNGLNLRIFVRMNADLKITTIQETGRDANSQ